MKFLLIPILLSLVSNKLLSYPLTRSDHLVEGDIRIKNVIHIPHQTPYFREKLIVLFLEKC